MGSTRSAQRDAMAQEATIDCYNEAEQLTGFFTMIHDNLAVPFETRVLGMSAAGHGEGTEGQPARVCTALRGGCW